jgi:tetratricopeptide (TPR) repeat protein
MHDRLGRFPEALRWVSRGLNELAGEAGGPASAVRAELLVFYGSVRQTQGRSADAIAWSRRAVGEAERAGNRKALAQALFILDWAHAELGRPGEANGSARALALYEDLGDLAGQAVVLNGMGGFAYWEGRWDDALELYRRGREACERLGDSVTAADGTYNIAEILVDQGRLEEAELLTREAMRVWRASGSRLRVAHAVRLLGRIASRSSRPAEGMELLRQARAEFSEVGARSDVVETDARIAGALVRGGHAKEGLELASAALRRAAGVHVPLLQRLRGYALIQLGDLESGRDALRASLDSARSQGADYEAAVTLDGLVRLAELTDDIDTGSLLAERDTTLSRLGVVYLPPFPVTGPLRQPATGATSVRASGRG